MNRNQLVFIAGCWAASVTLSAAGLALSIEAVLTSDDITAVFVDSTPTVPDCAAGITVTVEATVSTACDLDGSQQLNLTFGGADGYDDARVRQEAADYGCGSFAVIDGTATGLNCDY